jgi:hypothetical protein
MPPLFRARGFGLRWAADTPLPLLLPDAGEGAPDVVVRRVATLPPREGTPLNNGALFADGIRFAHGAALFEMRGGDRIDWSAPADTPPPALYSTVAALLLAWRGAVPLHASAVAVDGRAIALAGLSGTGKSSLAAALAAEGAALVSDDLSVLTRVGGQPRLVPGRPAIRLLPEPGGAPEPLDALGKRALRPAMVPPDAAVPLAMLVVLGGPEPPPGIAGRVDALRRQLFRPRWMRALPGVGGRRALLTEAAAPLRCLFLPAGPASAAPPRERALGLLEALSRA